MLSSHSAPRGVLKVELLDAKNLKGEDGLLGKNDPFVELWLDKKYKERSEEVKNTDTPVWNQTFTFNISEGSSEHKLYFKVLDKDVVHNDKIGEGHVDIAPAFKGERIDTWAKLPHLLGLASHGEVHFIISFEAS